MKSNTDQNSFKSRNFSIHGHWDFLSLEMLRKIVLTPGRGESGEGRESGERKGKGTKRGFGSGNKDQSKQGSG